MSTAPDPTETRLRAALTTAAPAETHVDDGLADLQGRLRGDQVVALRPPSRRWLAVAAAVTVLVLGAGALALFGRDDGGRVDTTPAGDPTTSSTTVPAATSVPAAELQFRPVLVVDTCDALLGPAPDARPDPTGVTCYEVGPVAADGTDLQDAEVADQEGSWVVNVRARSDAVDRMNAMFNACFDASDTCPPVSEGAPGAVAVIWRGTVVVAPAVNGPDLADDAFTLAGDFDRATASELAAAINAG